LGDWFSERLKSRIPSEGEERDVQRAKGRRLSRDLHGFDELEEHKEEDKGVQGRIQRRKDVVQEEEKEEDKGGKRRNLPELAGQLIWRLVLQDPTK
jgi:hypothetical protein